jgi:hypothetical protein
MALHIVHFIDPISHSPVCTIRNGGAGAAGAASHWRNG